MSFAAARASWQALSDQLLQERSLTETSVDWQRFRSMASQLVEAHCGRLRLRVDRDRPGLEILRWRAATLYFPKAWLIAGSSAGKELLRRDVEVLPRTIAPTSSVVHLHSHLSASLSFEQLWQHLCLRRGPILARNQKARSALSPPRSVRESLIHENAADRNFTRLIWYQQLLQSLILRLELADSWRIPGVQQVEFLSKIDAPAIRNATALLKQLHTDQAHAQHLAVLSHYHGSLRLELRKLFDLFAGRSETTRSKQDILDAGHPWPEGALVRQALIAVGNPDNPCQAHCSTYLRTQLRCFDHITHNRSPGLRQFASTFERMNGYDEGLGNAERLAASRQSSTLRLGGIELRKHLTTSSHDLDRAIKEVETANETSAAPPTVLIHHLVRATQPPLSKPTTHAERAHEYAKKLRRTCRKHRDELQQLLGRLRTQPKRSQILRGLDVAGVESEGPLWLSAGWLKEFRAAIENAAQNDEDLHPPHLTLHVGEDQSSLAAGLRAVHEPFLWNLMRRGDRLGHALALEPQTKFHNTPVPRFERMLDLAWMIYVSDRHLIAVDHSELRAQLSHELGQHLKESDVDRSSDDSQQFIDQYSRSFPTPAGLQEALGRRPDDPPDELLWHLVARFLQGDEELHRPWPETPPQGTQAEEALLEQARIWLCRYVATWPSCIEINPSSNLVIAGYRYPMAQPHMTRRATDDPQTAVLPLAINVDDALTFATTLEEEFAYAWAGMTVEQGLCPTYAREWLEECARNSTRFSFGLPDA